MLAALLSRRFALLDGDVESVEIELPRLGHHIALHHHRPAVQRWREPVIVCHGLGANRFNMDFAWGPDGSPRWSLVRMLAARGFDVWGLELRGRGRARVPSGARWCVDDEVKEDVPAAIETVLALSGAERVLWVGHSKGSILQYLLHAERLPAAERVAGFVAIGSPGTFAPQRAKVGPLVALGAHYARIGRPIPVALFTKLVLPVSGVIGLAGRLIPFGLGMEGPVLRRAMASLTADISPGVMEQFATWFRGGGAITRADGSRYEDGYANITAPILLVAGSKDELAPPETLEFVRDRVSSKDVTLRVMGRAQGCRSDYGHGDLVIGPHAPDEVFPLVAEWLEAHAEGV